MVVIASAWGEGDEGAAVPNDLYITPPQTLGYMRRFQGDGVVGCHNSPSVDHNKPETRGGTSRRRRKAAVYLGYKILSSLDVVIGEL